MIKKVKDATNKMNYLLHNNQKMIQETHRLNNQKMNQKTHRLNNQSISFPILIYVFF